MIVENTVTHQPSEAGEKVYVKIKGKAVNGHSAKLTLTANSASAGDTTGRVRGYSQRAHLHRDNTKERQRTTLHRPATTNHYEHKL